MKYCESYHNVTQRHNVSKKNNNNNTVGKMAHRLAPCRLAMGHQSVKKPPPPQYLENTSAKHNGINEMRSTSFAPSTVKAITTPPPPQTPSCVILND